MKPSAELLRPEGIGQVFVSGDTRFDRVAAIAAECQALSAGGKIHWTISLFSWLAAPGRQTRN